MTSPSSVSVTTAAGPSDAERAEIAAMPARLVRAWAAHDATAFAELEQLIERACETGDRARELRARLAHAWLAEFTGEADVAEVGTLVEDALSFFGERGDDAGL